MKAIIPQLIKKNGPPLYIQLYDYIRKGISTNELKGGERLPSVRSLAGDLRISVTTVNLAYQQLLVEGYIHSKPRSAYYINDIRMPDTERASAVYENTYPQNDSRESNDVETFIDALKKDESEFLYDTSAFDFIKWKKSLTKVLNEHSELLLNEGNPQGEYSLRYEIQQYLYRVRGIDSHYNHIIIGAGIQQITGQLSKLLLIDKISDLVVEKPGYDSVHNIFRDYGLTLHPAEVEQDGINPDSIFKNRRCAIYTSPSNQFPTGAVMPAGKRYDLLRVAGENDSYIIEDDYDSELRYFGNPIPPLKSLDRNDSVIYLSSFSSTLFPAVKISYMILPKKISVAFKTMRDRNTQTCSKTEQLALAYYMGSGNYHTHVGKLRRLYAQKLQATINVFEKYGKNMISLIHSSSGVNMLIEVNSKKETLALCETAKTVGISTEPVTDDSKRDAFPQLILHFYKIPLDKIESSIKSLIELWI